MEPDAKYVLVGSVTLVLVSLTIFAALWLMRSGEGEGADFYTVYFREQSLSGLQIDSNVTMKGINIGSVHSLQILPDDIERVQVVLEIQSGTPVKADTQALIQRNLLTGLATVELARSTQGSQSLSEIPSGERYPVIPEGRSDLQALQSTLPELLDKTRVMITHAGDFFSDENRESVAKILNNIETISDRAVRQEGDLSKTLEAAKQLSDDMRALIKNFDKRVVEVADSFRSMAEIVSRRVDDVGSDFGKAVQSFTGTLEEFDNPRSLFLGPSKDTLGPGEKQK